MAFMMPVMKNQYNIYPTRSRNSSTCSGGGGRSRTVSESAKSITPDVLSTSPRSTVSEPAPHPRFSRSDSQSSRTSSSSSDGDGGGGGGGGVGGLALPTPKSGSHNSLQSFHSKLLEKLRRKFRSKEISDEDGSLEDEHKATGTRSSS